MCAEISVLYTGLIFLLSVFGQVIQVLNHLAIDPSHLLILDCLYSRCDAELIRNCFALSRPKKTHSYFKERA